MARPTVPEFENGAEAWMLFRSKAAALGIFERKILCEIFGPVRVTERTRVV